MKDVWKMEYMKAQLSELLRKVEMLDPEEIPESRKMVSVWELEGTPVRMKNIISTLLHADTVWAFVHAPGLKTESCRFYNSRARLSELVAAVDEAVKILTNELRH